jgi:hypothetical protein
MADDHAAPALRAAIDAADSLQDADQTKWTVFKRDAAFILEQKKGEMSES